MAGLHHLRLALRAPACIIVIRFRPGTVTAAVQRQLNGVGSQFCVVPPVRPADLIDFGQVTYLPSALGVILAVLAMALISYVLVFTVRRRRRELAVVKALGFTRSQLRWTITLSGLIALLPATAAARTRPSLVLRSE